MQNDIRQLTERKLNFFQTLKAVAWGFFGVRKGKSYHEDIAKLNPIHLIIAGVLAALLMVLLLIAAARWFISAAVA